MSSKGQIKPAKKQTEIKFAEYLLYGKENSWGKKNNHINNNKTKHQQQLIKEHFHCTISGILIASRYRLQVWVFRILNLARYALIDVKFGISGFDVQNMC